MPSPLNTRLRAGAACQGSVGASGQHQFQELVSDDGTPHHASRGYLAPPNNDYAEWLRPLAPGDLGAAPAMVLACAAPPPQCGTRRALVVALAVVVLACRCAASPEGGPRLWTWTSIGVHARTHFAWMRAPTASMMRPACLPKWRVHMHAIVHEATVASGARGWTRKDARRGDGNAACPHTPVDGVQGSLMAIP